MRQTWRRVIPAARRTPISRTRSRTFIVRVLTMPSAAMMHGHERQGVEEAEDAAERVARWRPGSGRAARPRGRRARGRAGRAPCGRRPWRRARSGRRRRRRRRRRAVGRRPASRRGRPRRCGPGSGPLGDADDPQVERARRRPWRRSASSPTTSPRRSARAAGTITAPPCVEGGQGRGPVAGDEGQPAVGGEVRADHRRARRPRCPSTARSNVAIGLTRGDARHARRATSATPSSAAAGRIEVDELVAGHDVGRARRAAAARACWPTRRARRPSPARWRAPRGSASVRLRSRTRVRAGEPLLEREDEPRTGSPARRASAGSEERHEQRRDQQDAVDGEGADRRRPSRRRAARRAGRRAPTTTKTTTSQREARRAGRAAGRAAPGAPRPAGCGRRGRAGSMAAASGHDDDRCRRRSGRARAARRRVERRRSRRCRRQAAIRSPGARPRTSAEQPTPTTPTTTRLDEDEALDLAAGRAGRPQQADLADALDDGHREGVEDEERAGEQGDRGDQRGRRLEVGRRGAQRGGEVRGRGEDVRLDGERDLEGGGDTAAVARRARGRCPPGSRPVVAEDGLRRPRSGRRRSGPTRRPSGPSPARIPTTRYVAGAPAPEQRELAADGQAVLRARGAR